MSGELMELTQYPPVPEATSEEHHEVGDSDNQELLSKDATSTPTPQPSSRLQYLTEPPDSWRPQPKCPRSFSDCMFQWIGKLLGGRFRHEPEDMLCGDNPCLLSATTQTILKERVFHDLDPSDIVDYHVHIVGHGDSGSKCFINDNMKTWWRPYNRLKSIIFMAAAQAPDMEGGDMQYMSRLIRLLKHFVPACILSSNPSGEQYRHGKCCLLAFDAFYEKNGNANRNKTTLYVPNDYAFLLSQDHPQYFYSVGSVNPYRTDALKELERCAENGVSIIKWLPNSMGIDLRDSQCHPFYRKMKELDMALLVHIGEEHSVDAAFLDNDLGNPLLLREPLKFGVRVIAAHCGTEGHAVDFDARDRPRIPCFELFLRLMRVDAWKGLLFGDISAVCAFRRVEYLKQLMEETTIHDRLVYGSDYPVPAINLVVHTSKLHSANLITADERDALNELYDYNPLLFDLACKRLLSFKDKKFPTSVFKEHTLLPPMRKTPFNTGTSVDPEIIPENYDDYQDERPPTPVEGGQTLLVEVEIHDDSSSTEATPLDNSRVNSSVVVDRRQEDGEIEVEDSNEETKLLVSHNP
ncbi:uncharacterized protein LOC135346463 isoform X2 [Halichondria panicea]|uniref:uncharacterized protein LOC135346463 isoform X2 n=1 Tax=Halichondria panicea TaxID=6063 RepID=UPI00312B3954